MNAEKLAEIIAEKNDRLEREAVQTAEHHIEQIIKLNECIATAKSAIAEHQSELKALEVKQITASSILGE